MKRVLIVVWPLVWMSLNWGIKCLKWAWAPKQAWLKKCFAGSLYGNKLTGVLLHFFWILYEPFARLCKKKTLKQWQWCKKRTHVLKNKDSHAEFNKMLFIKALWMPKNNVAVLWYQACIFSNRRQLYFVNSILTVFKYTAEEIKIFNCKFVVRWW